MMNLRIIVFENLLARPFLSSVLRLLGDTFIFSVKETSSKRYGELLELYHNTFRKYSLSKQTAVDCSLLGVCEDELVITETPACFE